MNLKNRPWKTKEDVLIFSKVAGFTYNPIRVSRTAKSLKRDPTGTSRRRRSSKRIVNHYNINEQAKCETMLSNQDGSKHPIDIIKFNIIPPNGRYYGGGHGARKPVKLFEYLIKTYTNKGDTVLDNVIGSGTTVIATHNTGRRFIGMEKDAEIYKMAAERITNETRQMKI